MNGISVLEWNHERVITTAQLAAAYETNPDNIKKNFSRNKGKFTEGRHYYFLEGENLRTFKAQAEISEGTYCPPVVHDKVTNSPPVPPNINQLYLWTRRGASRHCKILDTKKAWEQFDYLEDAYFDVRQQAIDRQNLSPAMQVTFQMVESLARQELEQKRQAVEIEDLKQTVGQIRDAFSIRPDNWREDTAAIINSIANSLGGGTAFKNARLESYELMSQKYGVDLKTRLSNKKQRALEAGQSKTSVTSLTYLDVIGEGEKLIKWYVMAVQEMALKYGIERR